MVTGLWGNARNVLKKLASWLGGKLGVNVASSGMTSLQGAVLRLKLRFCARLTFETLSSMRATHSFSSSVESFWPSLIMDIISPVEGSALNFLAASCYV